MNFKIGELVVTPIGIGTVEGCVRLRGRILVLVNTLPEELREADASLHGLVQVSMVAEKSVKRFEEAG